jgi:hypothetical protein
MNRALYWDEVEVGNELPTLEKIATTQMLAKWAGASGDFNPLHYEFSFAKSQGVGTPIVHGQLKRAWLVQLVMNWIGELGSIRKLSCQFRAIDYPVGMISMTEPITNEPTHYCKGKVTNKYMENGISFVEAEIWVEDANGKASTPGKTLVILPKRG